MKIEKKLQINITTTEEDFKETIMQETVDIMSSLDAICVGNTQTFMEFDLTYKYDFMEYSRMSAGGILIEIKMDEVIYEDTIHSFVTELSIFQNGISFVHIESDFNVSTYQVKFETELEECLEGKDAFVISLFEYLNSNIVIVERESTIDQVND